MAERKEIVIANTRSMVDLVSQREEHRDLSPRAKRQVMNALVTLDKSPSEADADKLLTIVGDRFKLSLNAVIPNKYMFSVLPEKIENEEHLETEDQAVYRVRDLITIFGVSPVYSAVEFSYESGLITDEEGNDIDESLIILAGAKVASRYDLDDFTQINDFVGWYAGYSGSTTGQTILDLATMTEQQMEAKVSSAYLENSQD